MTKLGLTAAQKEVYDFLVIFHNQHGIYPTYRQIMRGSVIDGEGFETQVISERKSTSNVWRIMHQLIERGWIKTSPGRDRAIIIL